MHGRVLRRYEWSVPAAAARTDLDACLTAALSHREALLADEEDPRFLHPARSVLILMDDAEVSDADLLAAASLVETGEAALVVPAAVLATLPRAAAAYAASVPRPGAERAELLESLVGAAPETRLIACAERLDLTRHAHMLPGFDAAHWLAEVLEVYLPVARRTHERLALRFERWAVAWQRRLQA